MSPEQAAKDWVLLLFVVIPGIIFLLGSWQESESKEREKNKTKYNNLSQEERLELSRQPKHDVNKENDNA